MYNTSFKFARQVLIFILFVFSAQAETISLESDKWKSVKYRKIEANHIEFSKDQIRIRVNKSASPLVSQLPKAMLVNGFSVQGQILGSKIIEDGKFDEDSVLRVGLVLDGTKTLSTVKRWLAADWVIELFELAKGAKGIDRIQFFNITNRKTLVGTSRVNPSSDLISENIHSYINNEEKFDFTVKLDSPFKVLALWISADGDNSKSIFETRLNQITVLEVP